MTGRRRSRARPAGDAPGRESGPPAGGGADAPGATRLGTGDDAIPNDSGDPQDPDSLEPRYRAGIDPVRGIWADRSLEILRWSRDNQATWLWDFVNKRLHEKVESPETALVDSALRSVFDRVGHGVFLLSSAGRLLHANPAATRLLAGSGLLELQGDGLAGRIPAAAEWLAGATRTLFEQRTVDARVYGRLADPGRNDAPLLLRIERLQHSTNPAYNAAIPLALLQAWPDDHAPLVDELALQGWYGLSPAEARLARAFAEGTGLQDFADRHGLSMNTVRTQFAHLRHKLGARDQADVMRIILSRLAY